MPRKVLRNLRRDARLRKRRAERMPQRVKIRFPRVGLKRDARRRQVMAQRQHVVAPSLAVGRENDHLQRIDVGVEALSHEAAEFRPSQARLGRQAIEHRPGLAAQA